MRQLITLTLCCLTTLVKAHFDLSTIGQLHSRDVSQTLRTGQVSARRSVLMPRWPGVSTLQDSHAPAPGRTGSPVKAGYKQRNGGIAWTKDIESKEFDHNGCNGNSKSKEDLNKASAGGFGTTGGVFNAWSQGKKTKVSGNLEPGSRLIVSTTQADGTRGIQKYTRPGPIKQEFESGFLGYHMQLDAELHGKGKARVRASQ